jgi:hypothetical protein
MLTGSEPALLQLLFELVLGSMAGLLRFLLDVRVAPCFVVDGWVIAALESEQRPHVSGSVTTE